VTGAWTLAVEGAGMLAGGASKEEPLQPERSANATETKTPEYRISKPHADKTPSWGWASRNVRPSVEFKNLLFSTPGRTYIINLFFLLIKRTT
jgi:hypothetical protein